MLLQVPVRKKVYDTKITLRDSSILIEFKYDNVGLLSSRDVPKSFIDEVTDEEFFESETKLIIFAQEVLKEEIHKYNNKRYLKRLAKLRKKNLCT